MYARGWAVRTFPIRTVEQVGALRRFSVDPVRARRATERPGLHKGGALGVELRTVCCGSLFSRGFVQLGEQARAR